MSEEEQIDLSEEEEYVCDKHTKLIGEYDAEFKRYIARGDMYETTKMVGSFVNKFAKVDEDNNCFLCIFERKKIIAPTLI